MYKVCWVFRAPWEWIKSCIWIQYWDYIDNKVWFVKHKGECLRKSIDKFDANRVSNYFIIRSNIKSLENK